MYSRKMIFNDSGHVSNEIKKGIFSTQFIFLPFEDLHLSKLSAKGRVNKCACGDAEWGTPSVGLPCDHFGISSEPYCILLLTFVNVFWFHRKVT